MGGGHPQVEFLDDGEGSEVDDVLWLDEEGIETHHSRLLPRRATPRRIAGSLLVFALGFSLTGFSGLAALRHDQAVAAAANELILREVDVGDAVTLTDPGQLGGTNGWRIEPSAAIAVGVTNESPDSITLLPGATLSGPGLTAPSTLSPAGALVLAPGQSGRLTGTVTVDCGVQSGPSAQFSAKFSAKGGDTVLVQARTQSGAVGVAALNVGPAGTDAVRQQICREQGEGLAASFFPVSVDAAKHDFTVGVSARSLAAQPLKYWLATSYQLAPGTAAASAASSGSDPDTLLGGLSVVAGLSPQAIATLLPGVQLAAAEPVGQSSGSLAPGASTSAGYEVHVRSCPSSMPHATADLVLQMFLDDEGQPAYFQSDSFDLATLVAAACGLIA